MDRSAFDQVLVPELARAGLQGTYLNKAGTVKEGEAIFFSACKWRQAAHKDLELRQCFSPAALAPGPCLSPPASVCVGVLASLFFNFSSRFFLYNALLFSLREQHNIVKEKRIDNSKHKKYDEKKQERLAAGP